MEDPIKDTFPIVAPQAGGELDATPEAEELKAVQAAAKQNIISENPNYPLVDPMSFMFSCLKALEMSPVKDPLIEMLGNSLSNVSDSQGNKLFKDSRKLKDFLRVLAYPNLSASYQIPHSFQRALKGIRPVKLSPLMKRTLKQFQN